MIEAPVRRCTYLLDREDRVMRVDHEWTAFANENGVPELATSAIGQPVSGFFADDETKEFYRSIHSAARESGRSFQVPFRCDGNGLRRDMLLLVVPLKDGVLRLQGLLLDESQSDPTHDHPSSCIKCSLCLCVDADGKTFDAAHLLPPEPSASIRYQVCPTCRRLIEETNRPEPDQLLD